MRVLVDIRFVIFKDNTAGGNYTLARRNDSEKHHAHFSNPKAAHIVKKQIMRGVKCKVPYLRKNQQRLLTKDEFNQLTEEVAK